MMLVSPLYIEQLAGETKSCYTSRPIDYATNADTYARFPNAIWTNRTVGNLADGIYAFDVNTCFLSQARSPPPWSYAKMDLKRNLHLNKIVLHSQPNQLSLLFEQTAIYAGITFDENMVNSGNFSGFKEVGRLTGPKTIGEFQSFKIVPPLEARYVVFLKLSKNSMLLCHVEIF
jgi:hypothetical protein